MDLLESLQNVEILVIGDIMLDRFWWGEVSRISPEAPVPIVRLDHTSNVVGGAANVAANIAGLGATPILVGCVGDDNEGNLLPELLNANGVSPDHFLKISGRPTTVKTRIVARGQHVARVDQEVTELLSSTGEAEFLQIVLAKIDSVKAVVISDYAKGTLTDRILLETLRAAERAGIPAIVDPKGKDYAKYRGASVLTPNKREAAEACNLYVEHRDVVAVAGQQLSGEFDRTAILITEGENGMTLFEKGAEPFHTHATAHEVFDVTGAGDTVAAAMAVAIGNGNDLRDAVSFANLAAGIAVEKMGTAVVSLQMIRKRFQ